MVKTGRKRSRILNFLECASQIHWQLAGASKAALKRTLDISDLLGPGKQLLAAVLEKTPFGVVVLDQDLRYLFLNPMAAQLNGLPVEDHLGRPAIEVVPHVFPMVEPLYRKVFASGLPIEDISFAAETSA